ncbi:synaptonemal complex protein 1 [Paraburkholderia aspalathi]|uniref:hypothetical protein n=1 Tax=Paraburkholderia aspalathi TaxID=1324617 RepID=UPI0038BBA2FC
MNGEIVVNLLDCLDTYQELKRKNASNTEIIRTLIVEKLTLEQLSRPLNIAAEIAEQIRTSSLRVEGLPDWPQGAAADIRVSSARLVWMMDILENPAVQERLDELLPARDADFVRENLLVFVKAARDFPSTGTVFEKWEALQHLLRRIPLLSDLLSHADMRLQPALGAYAEVLRDDATVMRLFDAVMSPGTSYEKGKKLAGMVDYSIFATKGLREAARATTKALHWAVQPVLLAGTKAWEYRSSAYGVNWLSAPRMIYPSVRDYLKEDFDRNPRDYEQLLIGGDIPNRLMKVAFASNQIELPENPTTAEYIEAYAAAGSKLSSKTEWVFQRWLEISIVARISRAIRQGESNQAREDLEVLGRTLKRYTREGVFAGLTPLMDILPYIPALKEAWDELAMLHEEKREDMQVEFAGRQQALQTMQDVIRLGNHATAGELKAMQQTLKVMQESLAAMGKERGMQPSWADVMQKELHVIRAVMQESLSGTSLEEALDRLEAIQASLEIATHTPGDRQQKLQVKPEAHEDMLQLRAHHEVMQKELRKQLERQGIQTELKLMEKELDQMLQTLTGMPQGPGITDVRSLHDWLAQATIRLATSDKPGIQWVVSEIEKMGKDFLAKNLCQLIIQAQQAIIQAFTKEIELTPDEIETGWFPLDADYSTGTLLAGMFGGAAAGVALTIGLPWLLSRLGAFASDEVVSSSIMKTTTTGGELTRIIGTPHAGPYASVTTEPMKGGNRTAGWKVPALGAGLGAGAGLLLTLLLKPPFVAKRGKDSLGELSDVNQTGAGRLYEDEGRKGIILSPEEEGELFGQLPERERGGRQKRGFSPFNWRRPKKDKKVETSGGPSSGGAVGAGSVARPEDVERIRNSWSEDTLTAKANEHLLQVHKGAVIRMGPELHVEEFIRKYIQDIIDAHPEGRGTLISPDSKLSFRTGTSGHATATASLYELATGKFDYLKYNPVWEYQGDDHTNRNPFLEFRKTLLPDASRFMTREGHNLANKKPGKGLPDRVSEAFKENLKKINADEIKKENLAKFYETSFMQTAEELSNRAELVSFRPQLEKYLSKEIVPFQMFFCGNILSEVLALRVRDKILAWDLVGGILITDTISGRRDKEIQKWVIKHLTADAQYKYSNDQVRNRAFEYHDRRDAVTHLTSRYSPIDIRPMNRIGHDTSRAMLVRAEEDINSMVRTRGEYLLDCLVDGAYIAGGLLVSAALPGAGISAMMSIIALSAGLTFTKDLTKVILADSREQKSELMSSVLSNLLASLLIDGGLTLGIPLAKKLLLTGKIKIPWAKETNVAKDAPIAIASYHAANNAADVLNKNLVADGQNEDSASGRPQTGTDPTKDMISGTAT